MRIADMLPQVSTSTRSHGRIVEWNATRGYGFVDDGRRRIFAHIRDFNPHPGTPSLGELVHFTIGDDGKGRVCARQIVSQSAPTNPPFASTNASLRKLRGAHFLTVAIFLALPVTALWRLGLPVDRMAFCVWVPAVSLVSYLFYAWDKRRAQKSEWRLPEKMLLTWDLLGGWPGGFLAQRRLRHKCVKTSYQLTFWLIVAIHNYAALDWQLDWRLSRRAREYALSWFDSEADKPAKSSKRPLVY